MFCLPANPKIKYRNDLLAYLTSLFVQINNVGQCKLLPDEAKGQLEESY